MILSDISLKQLGETLLSPFREDLIQPSSCDLTLGKVFLRPRPGTRIDLRTDSPGAHMDRIELEELTLAPGECVLGSTVEVVKCPENLSARIEGKSSIGRLFLAVHITAGVIDAGWNGQITLEIVNHGPWEVVIWSGMRIAQISYWMLTTKCETAYGSPKLGSHYNGQRGPTPSARAIKR